MVVPSGVVVISPPVSDVNVNHYWRVPAGIERIKSIVPCVPVVGIVPSVVIIIPVSVTPSIIINRIIDRIA